MSDMHLLPNTLVQEFIHNFESTHTRKNYENDLRFFADYLQEHGRKFGGMNDLERADMVEFRNFLQELELAPKTIHRRLSTISSFFDFLLEKSLMEFNPCQAIRRPRQEVKSPTNDLSDEQVSELLASVDESTASGLLHKSILACLFMTGLRKSEVTKLKVKDFYCKDKHFYLHIRAKGGKFLQKLVPEPLVEQLQKYLASRIGVDEEDYLFVPTRNPKSPSHLNKPLDPKSVYYIFKIYAKKIGLNKTISPHSARATFIGSALENGADLWKVSKDVGHSSVRTTQDYNKRQLKPEDSPSLKLGYLKKVE